jgi:hypothetical protein
MTAVSVITGGAGGMGLVMLRDKRAIARKPS